jgi:diguanylate cyclase (GGDEF)-like protein
MKQESQRGGRSSLYSQATFKILTRYEFTRAQRYPTPVTLLCISLNLTKAKTTTAASLKQLFAGFLNASLRDTDIPAYYDDNYLVLLPTTNEAGGRVVAKRLIAKLKGTKNFTGSNIHIGIATHPGGQGISSKNLIKQAESALREAREDGTHAYKLYSGE